MRSEIRFFINFFIWGVVSLLFVFAGKYDSEAVYLLGLFAYTHLFWSHLYDIERHEKRIKRYKDAYKDAVNSIYGMRSMHGGYVDTDIASGSAGRTDTNTDSEV